MRASRERHPASLEACREPLARRHDGLIAAARDGVLDAPERGPLSRGWSTWPVVGILLVVAVFAAGVLGMAIELMR